MTELVARAFLPRDGSLQRASRTGAAALALGLVALGLVALGLVQALDASGVSFALGLAGGLALMAFLLLTIRHYDTAIAIGLRKGIDQLVSHAFAEIVLILFRTHV